MTYMWLCGYLLYIPIPSILTSVGYMGTCEHHVCERQPQLGWSSQHFIHTKFAGFLEGFWNGPKFDNQLELVTFVLWFFSVSDLL
jgi:hypothetical protein